MLENFLSKAPDEKLRCFVSHLPLAVDNVANLLESLGYLAAPRLRLVLELGNIIGALLFDGPALFVDALDEFDPELPHFGGEFLQVMPQCLLQTAQVALFPFQGGLEWPK